MEYSGMSYLVTHALVIDLSVCLCKWVWIEGHIFPLNDLELPGIE
jgi:hypothetical protein